MAGGGKASGSGASKPGYLLPGLMVHLVLVKFLQELVQPVEFRRGPRGPSDGCAALDLIPRSGRRAVRRRWGGRLSWQLARS